MPKKELSQIFTPANIAQWMAIKLLENNRKETVRILEPSAGEGALIVAVLQYLEKSLVRDIYLEIFEIDPVLLLTLDNLLQEWKNRLGVKNKLLAWNLRNEDFLLAETGVVDFVIANPPYRKIAKNDPRAQHLSSLVWGQPNLYGLFMGRSMDWLKPDGSACFITPRSWMTGPYFKRVREKLDEKKLQRLHHFTNRNEPFGKGVLQETVISFFGGAHGENVYVSTSVGEQWNEWTCPRAEMVCGNEYLIPDRETVSRPGVSKAEMLVLNGVGLQVRTGKVVAFRAKEWIGKDQSSVPMLRLEHVKNGEITWQGKVGGDWVKNPDGVHKLVLAPENMVVVRRFSPPEGQRIMAAPLLVEDWWKEGIGLENHLNYIRAEPPLSRKAATMLAEYLNGSDANKLISSRISGTQINARDLKELLLPKHIVDILVEDRNG